MASHPLCFPGSYLAAAGCSVPRQPHALLALLLPAPSPAAWLQQGLRVTVTAVPGPATGQNRSKPIPHWDQAVLDASPALITASLHIPWARGCIHPGTAGGGDIAGPTVTGIGRGQGWVCGSSGVAMVQHPRAPRSSPRAAGADAGAGEAGRGAAAAGGRCHPALRAARVQAGGHEAAPGTRPYAVPPRGTPHRGDGRGQHPPGVPAVTPRCHQADRGLLDKHYQQLRQKPFYPALLSYMTSGPLVAMVSTQPSSPPQPFWGPGAQASPVPQVWEGYNVVRSTRAMVGDTNSAQAAAGTIRGDFSMHVSR